MNISPRKICRLRYLRHKWGASRFKLLIGLFIALSFTYQLVPKLLFKMSWTEVGWHDTDFRLEVDESEIIILRWTSQWGQYSDAEVLTPNKCPYLEPSRKAASGEVFNIPCRITYDRRYMRASDAMVFHAWDLTREEMPKVRSKDQLWVYLEQECPLYDKLDLHDYPNVFNWTMTYRRDSDVYYPYGHLVPIPTTESPSDTDLLTTPNSIGKIDLNLGKRPNLVAWIVSSCDSDSKREYFVKELQNYIPVSVYGWCGQECPTTSAGECYQHVGQTHKFYLSFENSLCKDYITEKFFNALRANLVPVVYGGTGLEDYSAIAPPGSYIDARNFSSAKHLAEYLVYLDRHEEEYMKYFKWKSKYKVIYSQGWCDLCQRVFEHLQFAPEFSTSVASERKRSYKWYGDLWTWWHFISYEPTSEQDKLPVTSGLSVIVPSHNYTLGAPACQSPITNLIGSETKIVDFEPGFFSRKGVTKWSRWLKSEVFG